MALGMEVTTESEKSAQGLSLTGSRREEEASSFRAWSLHQRPEGESA